MVPPAASCRHVLRAISINYYFMPLSSSILGCTFLSRTSFSQPVLSEPTSSIRSPLNSTTFNCHRFQTSPLPASARWQQARTSRRATAQKAQSLAMSHRNSSASEPASRSGQVSRESEASLTTSTPTRQLPTVAQVGALPKMMGRIVGRE